MESRLERSVEIPRRHLTRASLALLFTLVIALIAGCDVGAPSDPGPDAGADVSEPPPMIATAISCGDHHTCALTSRGGVRCWGYNSDGQLGTGSTESSTMPVDVVGLTTDVTRSIAGGEHHCALLADGVRCWGDNTLGQLGNASTADRLTPTAVSGLAATADLAGGFRHTCALGPDGAVTCWGTNTDGQLGNNSPDNSSVPVPAFGLGAGVVAITAGDDHTCVLTRTGGVRCWGNNSSGQLGNNSRTNSRIPVDVSGLTSGVTAIDAGGGTTCALTVAGAVRCWGENAAGQLGNGTTVGSTVPVTVSALSVGMASISVGYLHACAVTAAGALRCWGGNDMGQLGNGTKTASTVPVEVVGSTTGITAVSTAAYHTCALTDVGGVRCWGLNSAGQLGNGPTIAGARDSAIPVPVLGFP